MTEPTDDRVRDALRSWDPASRVPSDRSLAALDDIRHEIRRQAARRTARMRAGRRYRAFAAAIAIASLTLALFWRLIPSAERSPREGLASPTAGERPAQQVMLVASNGVRVYWTIPAPTVSTSGSGAASPARRDR